MTTTIAVPRKLWLAALASLAALLAAPHAAQPQPGPEPGPPQRVMLRERDVVGQRCSEIGESTLNLQLALPNGVARRVIDRNLRRLHMLTLQIDEEHKTAIRVKVDVERLRREQEDNGKTTVMADPLEGRSSVLLDRGAVDGLRGPPDFPLPAHAVAPGESWVVAGAEALRCFGAKGVYDKAEATLRLERIVVGPGGQRIAEISRTMTRSGTSPEGSMITETGTGTLVFDVAAGRPTEMRCTSQVEISAGGANKVVIGSGPRVSSTRWSYEQRPTYRIAPRAQLNVTQTERSESITDVAVGAVRRDDPTRQAVVRRHIETISVITRKPTKIDSDGRPLGLDLGVLASSRTDVVEQGRPEVPTQERTVRGPLHGLSFSLSRESADEALQLAAPDAVRRQVEQRVPAAEVDATVQNVTAALTALLQHAAVPGLPTNDVPVEYMWQLPDSMALEAVAGLFDADEAARRKVTVTQAAATVTFMDVREWGGRKRVALLLTRLQLEATSSDNLEIKADLPSVTFFDLDESRPLAMRGEGALRMTSPEGAATRITGAWHVRADTRYLYDQGPNFVREPNDLVKRLSGAWAWRNEKGEADARYVLQLNEDGSVTFTEPGLGSAPPAVQSGHWLVLDALPSDAAKRVRLVVALGERNRDVFAVVLDGTRLTLTRVENTPFRTGIFPALLNSDATWLRKK